MVSTTSVNGLNLKGIKGIRFHGALAALFTMDIFIALPSSLKSSDLGEYLDKCTAHGVPHLTSTESRGHRIVWTILLTFAVIFFTIHVFILLTKFFAFDVVTEWNTETDVIPQFPTVVLCDAAPLSWHKTSQGSMSHGANTLAKNDFLLQRIQSVWRVALTDGLDRLRNYSRHLNPISRKTLQPFTLNHQFGHRKQDAIVQCEYDGVACTIDNFTDVWLPYYHHCFSFEPSPSHVFAIGNYAGLSLILYADDRRGLLTDYERLKWFRGYYAILIEKGHMPSATNVIEVAAGYHTSIQFSQAHHTRSKFGKESCEQRVTEISFTLHDETGKYLPTQKYRYDEASCATAKVQLLFAEKCGCFSDLLPIPYDLQGLNKTWCHYVSDQSLLINDGYTLLNYTHVQIGSTALGINSAVFKKLAEYHACAVDLQNSLDRRLIKKPTCLKPCHSVEYREDTHSFQWPSRLSYSDNIEAAIDLSINRARSRGLSPAVLETLKDPTNSHSNWSGSLDEVRDSFLMVSIYTPNTGVMTTAEILVYPIGNLLSDFGGTLGLWIGCSVISIIELGWVFANCFRNCTKCRPSASKVDSAENDVVDVQKPANQNNSVRHI